MPDYPAWLLAAIDCAIGKNSFISEQDGLADQPTGFRANSARAGSFDDVPLEKVAPAGPGKSGSTQETFMRLVGLRQGEPLDPLIEILDRYGFTSFCEQAEIRPRSLRRVILGLPAELRARIAKMTWRKFRIFFEALEIGDPIDRAEGALEWLRAVESNRIKMKSLLVDDVVAVVRADLPQFSLSDKVSILRTFVDATNWAMTREEFKAFLVAPGTAQLPLFDVAQRPYRTVAEERVLSEGLADGRRISDAGRQAFCDLYSPEASRNERAFLARLHLQDEDTFFEQLSYVAAIYEEFRDMPFEAIGLTRILSRGFGLVSILAGVAGWFFGALEGLLARTEGVLWS